MSNQEAREELKDILGTIEDNAEPKKRLWDLFRKMKAPVVQEKLVTVVDHSEADALKLELERSQAQARCAKCRAKQNEIALAAAQTMPEVDLNNLNLDLLEAILKGLLNMDELKSEWLAYVKEAIGEPWASRFDLRHVMPTLLLAASNLTFLQILTDVEPTKAGSLCRFFKVIQRVG